MTKEQFIKAVEAKPNFIKWASVPVKTETVGDVEKWYGNAYISTPDGTNLYNVWFIVDTATNEATWQNQDQMEPSKNLAEKKMAALTNYLKATFFAYFVTNVDLDNNWAEAVVYTDGATLTKTTVLVYKKGTEPIAYKAVA